MRYDITADKEGLPGKSITTKLEPAEGREPDIRVIVTQEAIFGCEFEYEFARNILIPLCRKPVLVILDPFVLFSNASVLTP